MGAAGGKYLRLEVGHPLVLRCSLPLERFDVLVRLLHLRLRLAQPLLEQSDPLIVVRAPLVDVLEALLHLAHVLRREIDAHSVRRGATGGGGARKDGEVAGEEPPSGGPAPPQRWPGGSRGPRKLRTAVAEATR